jgi:hypothetical protein
MKYLKWLPWLHNILFFIFLKLKKNFKKYFNYKIINFTNIYVRYVCYIQNRVFYTLSLNTLSFIRIHNVFFKENINTSIFKESRNLPLVRFYNFLQSIVPDLLL